MVEYLTVYETYDTNRITNFFLQETTLDRLSIYKQTEHSLIFDEMDHSYEMKLWGKINIYNTASTHILSTLMVKWTT